MVDLVKDVHNLLLKSALKISFAESCTGGLVQKLITDSSGSSSYFEGGFVVYSNRLKHDLLDVPEQVLQEYGAVSSECALAMVNGLFQKTQADICVSVTGIAGPGGGSIEKPVGTVWFAFKFKDETEIILQNFSGNRQIVREKSAQFVLEKIKNYLLRG